MPISARTGPSRRGRDSESQIARPSSRGCGGVQPLVARRPVGGRGEAGAGIAIPICRAASAGRLSAFFCDMHRARPKSRGNPLEAPHACLRHRPRRPATTAGSKASIASFRYRPSSAAPRRPPARRSSSAVARPDKDARMEAVALERGAQQRQRELLSPEPLNPSRLALAHCRPTQDHASTPSDPPLRPRNRRSAPSDPPLRPRNRRSAPSDPTLPRAGSPLAAAQNADPAPVWGLRRCRTPIRRRFGVCGGVEPRSGAGLGFAAV